MNANIFPLCYIPNYYMLQELVHNQTPLHYTGSRVTTHAQTAEYYYLLLLLWLWQPLLISILFSV